MITEQDKITILKLAKKQMYPVFFYLDLVLILIKNLKILTWLWMGFKIHYSLSSTVN